MKLGKLRSLVFVRLLLPTQVWQRPAVRPLIKPTAATLASTEPVSLIPTSPEKRLQRQPRRLYPAIQRHSLFSHIYPKEQATVISN